MLVLNTFAAATVACSLVSGRPLDRRNDSSGADDRYAGVTVIDSPKIAHFHLNASTSNNSAPVTNGTTSSSANQSTASSTTPAPTNSKSNVDCGIFSADAWDNCNTAEKTGFILVGSLLAAGGLGTLAYYKGADIVSAIKNRFKVEVPAPPPVSRSAKESWNRISPEFKASKVRGKLAQAKWKYKAEVVMTTDPVKVLKANYKYQATVLGVHQSYADMGYQPSIDAIEAAKQKAAMAPEDLVVSRYNAIVEDMRELAPPGNAEVVAAQLRKLQKTTIADIKSVVRIYRNAETLKLLQSEWSPMRQEHLDEINGVEQQREGVPGVNNDDLGDDLQEPGSVIPEAQAPLFAEGENFEGQAKQLSAIGEGEVPDQAPVILDEVVNALNSPGVKEGAEGVGREGLEAFLEKSGAKIG